MTKTFIIAATTLGLLASTTASANTAASPKTAEPRAFDPITATYQPKTGVACIRSGWGIATNASNRLVRKGDCHDIAAWRQRGVALNVPKRATVAVELAAR